MKSQRKTGAQDPARAQRIKDAVEAALRDGFDARKFVPSVMTTGACTVPNYVKKKAGLKVEFHHVLGATIVEAREDGSAWLRQISATGDGAFRDLDAIVRAGRFRLPSLSRTVHADLRGRRS